MNNTKHWLWPRWSYIRTATTNTKTSAWRCVGAYGIGIHPSIDNFESFVEYIERFLGLPPHADSQLTRIDRTKDYEPGNLCWSDRSALGRNRNKGLNFIITHQGQTMTLAEWSEVTGIKSKTLWSRIHDYGLTPEQALDPNYRQRRRNETKT